MRASRSVALPRVNNNLFSCYRASIILDRRDSIILDRPSHKMHPTIVDLETTVVSFEQITLKIVETRMFSVEGHGWKNHFAFDLSAVLILEIGRDVWTQWLWKIQLG